MTKNRCSNSEVSRFVEYRDTFETNNKTMFGEWRRVEGGDNPKDVYAVYSYGYHFPMYIWDDEARVWVGNKDKYSRTTSVHQTKARPSEPIEQWFDTNTMKRIVYNGLAGAVANRME